MLAIGFPALAFDTNCFILAPAPGEECVIVDPGIGVVEPVREVLEEYRLKPAAVLLTHGHLDHVYSVTPVCGGSVAAYIHGDDDYRIRNALSHVDPAMLTMMEYQFGKAATWRDPDEVVHISDRETLTVAGLEVEVLHAPGHTEGSVMFALPSLPDGLQAPEEIDRTMVTGDVLFAGSIGRTDLPGGNEALMMRSLRHVVLPLADSTLVLPGHGPATTIRRERVSNPFLQGLR